MQGKDDRQPVRVRIVFLHGDRFNVTEEALANLYENTPQPFELVVVDGGSPPQVRDFLRREAQRRDFEVIRSERFLATNQARNIGLRGCNTDYVVFMESDVIVAAGWLEALLDCADATGAAIVSPLTCEDLPVHTVIHHAGGAFAPLENVESFLAPRTPDAPLRTLTNEIYHQKELVAEVAPTLRRTRTGTFERHCVLMRRDVLERIGPLDEKMLSTKEHLDISMAVMKAGGEIWFEPRALVTFLSPAARPLSRSDLWFFSLRWSDAWQRRTLVHFRQKWELAPNAEIDYNPMRLNWRRRQGIVRPLIESLPLIGRSYLLSRGLEWLAQPLERLLNSYYVARYERT